jgi:CheY-like chemotaxis protein
MTTVLVVDDEATVADALAAALRRAGYEAIVAYDGASALQAIAREGADVVLTDLVMAGMDGATLTRWLRSDPATHSVPVILMSMLAEERAAALCSEYSRFLRKPLRFDALYAAIEELCEPTEPLERSIAAQALQSGIH